VCIAEKLAVEPPRHRPLTWRERQKVKTRYLARREISALKGKERKRFVAASVKQALDADRPSMKEQNASGRSRCGGTKTKVRFQEKAAL